MPQGSYKQSHGHRYRYLKSSLEHGIRARTIITTTKTNRKTPSRLPPQCRDRCCWRQRHVEGVTLTREGVHSFVVTQSVVVEYPGAFSLRGLALMDTSESWTPLSAKVTAMSQYQLYRRLTHLDPTRPQSMMLSDSYTSPPLPLVEGWRIADVRLNMLQWLIVAVMLAVLSSCCRYVS